MPVTAKHTHYNPFTIPVGGHPETMTVPPNAVVPRSSAATILPFTTGLNGVNLALDDLTT